MIEILDKKEKDIFGFRIDGKIEQSDMELAFNALADKTKNNEKIKIYAEVKDMSLGNITAEAMKTEFGMLFKNPKLIANLAKGVLVTDIEWIKKAFAVECALIPTLTGKSFSFGEEDSAMEWLETDQREQSRMDVTFSEFAETSTLKVAGGFALGLLTAGLIGSTQRTILGKIIMISSVAAGIPLGIKILNNNRQLFKTIS